MSDARVIGQVLNKEIFRALRVSEKDPPIFSKAAFKLGKLTAR